MSEWKELKIDNLPSDILTGDYEFAFDPYENEPEINATIEKRLSIIAMKTSMILMYRTPEPLPPTHEEIMTKWWKRGTGIYVEWYKVTSYRSGDQNCYVFEGASETLNYFIGRESADIPPEGE